MLLAQLTAFLSAGDCRIFCLRTVSNKNLHLLPRNKLKKNIYKCPINEANLLKYSLSSSRILLLIVSCRFMCSSVKDLNLKHLNSLQISNAVSPISIHLLHQLLGIISKAPPHSNWTVQTVIFVIALVKLFSHVQETVLTHTGRENSLKNIKIVLISANALQKIAITSNSFFFRFRRSNICLCFAGFSKVCSIKIINEWIFLFRLVVIYEYYDVIV